MLQRKRHYLTEVGPIMSVSQDPEVATENHLLPVDVYQFWVTAIVSDDAVQVESVLTAADEPQRRRLLNGSFHFQDEELLRHNKYAFGGRPNKPLALCALSGALRVLRVLIGHGVHVTSQDASGHNVVHQLIFVAYYDDANEERCVTSYREIMRLVDLPTKRLLLLTEGNNGLRPLEAASQHGTLRFVHAIMETEGVYLVRQVARGLSIYQWYDVTEYESFADDNRRHVSPVRFLVTLDERKLSHSHVGAVFFKEPLGKWISVKISVNRPLIFVWALLRLVHILAYFALDISGFDHTPSLGPAGNATDTTGAPTSADYRLCEFVSPLYLSKISRLVLACYIITHSQLVLLWDLVGYIKTRRWLRTTRRAGPMCKTVDGKKRKAFACSLYYIRIQQTLAVLLAIAASRKVNEWETNVYSSGVRVACTFLSTWSLLYFVQLLPFIGYFVVAIQRMVRQMFNFGVVYAIFFFATCQAFFVTVNTSERQVCSGEFSTMSRGVYSTFAIMLNLVNPAELRLRHPGWIYALHVVYMFMVAILLINFLIAIMSSALSEVALHRPIIERLQRLSVALAVESRIDHLVAPYYRAMHRRHFDCVDDRVYLVRVTPPSKYAETIRTSKDITEHAPTLITQV